MTADQTGPATDATAHADAVSASSQSDGLEARPTLLTMLPSADAPVCEGDFCIIPGHGEA